MLEKVTEDLAVGAELFIRLNNSDVSISSLSCDYLGLQILISSSSIIDILVVMLVVSPTGVFSLGTSYGGLRIYITILHNVFQ